MSLRRCSRLALLLKICGFFLFCEIHPAIAAQLSTFDLKDQFGTNVVCRWPSDKPLVLVVADKKGYEGTSAWVEILRNDYSGKVRVLGIADVDGVPGPLRGFVRSQFKGKVNHPVLLDWEGQVLQVLRPKKGVPNVYVVGTNGTVNASFSGKATPEALAALSKALGPSASASRESHDAIAH